MTKATEIKLKKKWIFFVKQDDNFFLDLIKDLEMMFVSERILSRRICFLKGELRRTLHITAQAGFGESNVSRFVFFSLIRFGNT